MEPKNWKRRTFDAESFDMTPIIDVVFLLIIFFMLVCQFIAAEQFQVEVPDQISSAQKTEPQKTEIDEDQSHIQQLLRAKRKATERRKDNKMEKNE